ncbi:MAG: TIGR04295 family B12-binding domain-containing radical SAM protein [Acetobacteraceae bacterium]|nr:TIGR04295 family B12-binding domain-containing radical SAM protein [Acetobacteraceae bacterium]MBV8523819.1 TIGR04295 family B12-binding domain-containing radical SAM protein [Acetobacteraceae bacterium]MBV8590773.1 TIGR04295 family B12-binding domain-containing radical SAM protein [Acetobacteraceae bacterium]
MRVALVNPAWHFEHSIYFGCREPHLPLELGYAQALLEREGHDVLLLDGLLEQKTNNSLAAEVAGFAPEITVVATAPTYLFWRCAPPELRVPREFLTALGGAGGITVAVGPHGSATPGATLRKLGADIVIRGECESVIAALANGGGTPGVAGTASLRDGEVVLHGPTQAAAFSDLPPLVWPDAWIQRHGHHHHRFDAEPTGPGAEVEASRGCPYTCSFCAKMDYRDQYRRRTLPVLLEEIDALITQGVRYFYFIDEIFLPNRALLEALACRGVQFGVQTRIDLWKPEMLARLGWAGCVSIEAGVESLTQQGRESLHKDCRMSTDALTQRLILARRHVPFVQANLIATAVDDAGIVTRWREGLQPYGVWANDPVPLYPYPSSPDYRRLWGEPDDQAWERAHAHYLAHFERFSDIQDEKPLPLHALETECLPA